MAINRTLISVSKAPNPSQNTVSESYIILLILSAIYSLSVFFSVDYCQGGVNLLHVRSGDKGGGVSFRWRCGGVLGGALFSRFRFLLLCFCLFQTSVRAGNFSPGCSRYLISCFRYLSLLASLIQSFRVPYQMSIFTSCNF